MDQTHWLRRVEKSLLKSGLPAHYVNRTILELSDHVEASRVAGEELTLLHESPKELSAQLVRSYRKQGLWRRIPPAVLLLLPLPLAILMTFVYYDLSRLVLETLFRPDFGPDKIPLHVATTMWAFFYGGKLAIPLLSGIAARGIVRRMSRPWGWAAALFALQCFAAALIATSMQVSAAGVDLTLGLELNWPHLLGNAQLLSGLAIAIYGFWVVTRLRFEQQRAIA